MTFVKVYKHHFIGKLGTTVNPGSVIELEDDVAVQYVQRGMGEPSDGPLYSAPPPPEKNPPAIEREDLHAKLANAEKMVAVRQRPAAV